MAEQSGSAGVGLALGALSLIVLLQFAVGALRLITINGQVSAASRAGARAAADGYNRLDGSVAAEAIVAPMLASGSICRDVSVAVDGTWEPAGVVEVTVSCVVSLDDLGLVDFGSDGDGPARSRTIHHRAAEVVDSFRGSG